MSARSLTAFRILLLGGASVALHLGISVLQQRIAFGPLSLWPVLLFVVATLAVFALYAKVLGLAAHRLLTRAEKRQALVFPVIIGAALILRPVATSIDLYSYLGHGYQALAGMNPYTQPVKEIADSDIGRALMNRGWLPVHGVSPYGPLWTAIEVGIVKTTDNLRLQATAVKTIAFAFSLLSAWLIWMILGLVAPRSQLTGTLVYLWNPVIVMEFAGEGHNESLIVAAGLAALWLTVRAKPAASAFTLLAGALTKITGLVALPPLLVYAWRTATDRPRLVVRLTVAGACAGAIGALLFAPWWVGPATLDGLLEHGRPNILPSTLGVLFLYLIQSHSPEASAKLLSLVAGAAMTAVTIVASMRATDIKGLFRACAIMSVAYLLLAPVYWPWYVALPTAMLALTPSNTSMTIVFAFSVASRLASPLDRLRLNGLTGWPEIVVAITIVGLWLPAVVLLAVAFTRHGSAWMTVLRNTSRGRATPTLERGSLWRRVR